MASADRVTIPGSERHVDPDHRRVGTVDAGTEIDVTVYLRARAPVDWVDEEARRPPGQQRRLTRAEWAAAHGAGEADAGQVSAFAAEYGLTVSDVDLAQRRV